MKDYQSCFCVVVLWTIRMSHKLPVFQGDDKDGDGDGIVDGDGR